MNKEELEKITISILIALQFNVKIELGSVTDNRHILSYIKINNVNCLRVRTKKPINVRYDRTKYIEKNIKYYCNIISNCINEIEASGKNIVPDVSICQAGKNLNQNEIKELLKMKLI